MTRVIAGPVEIKAQIEADVLIQLIQLSEYTGWSVDKTITIAIEELYAAILGRSLLDEELIHADYN